MLHAVLMDRAMRLLKLPVTSRLTCISLYHRIYHYKDVVRRYLASASLPLSQSAGSRTP